MTSDPHPLWVLTRGFFASPRLTAALATTGVALASLTFVVLRIAGQPTLVAATATLLAIMALNFVARREELDWNGLPPVSLLVFLTWAGISLFWSEHRWATLGGLVSLAAFTAIGMFIAFTRDTIQIIRAVGDVLRVVLGASLVLEVFSGILIDTPIPFLGIQARIAELGPISGLAATRNQLGLLAVIAAITFVIELRTRSIARLTGVLSIVLAAITIALTRSPVVFLTAAVVGVAAAVIYGVRRVRPDRRQYWQFVILAASIIAVIVGWLLRSRLVALFNAGGELDYRLALWNALWDRVLANPLEGWGWIGRWHTDLPPYIGILTGAERQATSALNAFLDVWVQLGLVGFVIFVGMAGLAFVRSWLLAGRRRSVVYAWPAGVLVALLITALAESTMLVEFGWVMFVICCVKASQELSWRSALRPPPPQAELEPEAGR